MQLQCNIYLVKNMYNLEILQYNVVYKEVSKYLIFIASDTLNVVKGLFNSPLKRDFSSLLSYNVTYRMHPNTQHNLPTRAEYEYFNSPQDRKLQEKRGSAVFCLCISQRAGLIVQKQCLRELKCVEIFSNMCQYLYLQFQEILHILICQLD